MQQVAEVLIDELGRVLIPAALRARLGLTPGMTLVVEQADADQEGVLLTIQAESPAIVDKGGVWVISGESNGDLVELIRRQREQRIADLWRQV